MNHEVQILSDGDGIAVIGDSMAVERFLGATGLPSRDLGLPKLSTALRSGAGVAEAGSTIAASSGRWIKLTEKSAQQLKDFTPMKGSTDGVSRAITMNKGRTNGILEFITKPGPGSMLTNPAVLAGAAGLMAQVAMQQTMDEITDYLAAIDAKVDDVLRAQRDAVVADLIGVDFVIEEAMTIREQVGLVSEVTWSKVQATSATIARTQAYALLQLDALAEKLERKPGVPDLAKTSKEAEAKVLEWLAVLARCFQLQDAMAVLELDRVLDASADELDRHRIGLRTARQNRRELIARSTERLMARMDVAASTANAKVLLHPSASKAVVNATNQVAGVVVDFQGRLGIESGRESLDAKRWTEAATEAKDKVLATGAEGVDVAKRVGGETLERAKVTTGRAKAVTGRFSSEMADRALRRRGDDE